MPDPTLIGKPHIPEETQPKIEWSQAELDQRFPGNRLAQITTELGTDQFQAIIDLMEQTGAQVYLAGGIVRDSIIGKTPKDFDFIVSYQSETNKEIARAKFESFWGTPEITTKPDGTQDTKIVGSYGTIKLTGKNFGVYKFYPVDMPPGSEPFDISFPRTERAWAGTLGGSKEFDVQSDATLPVEEDIKRRDFTVNVLLLKLNREHQGQIATELLDYVDGLADLESRTLRAVGDPYQRINESLDRALRAIRFKHQKGFSMTAELDQAIFELGHGFDNLLPILQRRGVDGKRIVPAEKIAPEFLKSLAANPAGTIADYDRYGLLPDMFPDLYDYVPPQPKQLPKSIRSNPQLVERATAKGNPQTNRRIKQESLAHSIATIQYHHEQFKDVATTDEYLYLLFHELGKSSEMISDANADVTHFDPHYHEVSAVLAQKQIEQNKLYALVEDSPIRIHTDVIVDLAKRHAAAIGLLSTDIEVASLAENPRIVQQIHETFPGLTHDPLLRILESDMISTSTADVAQSQLTRLRTQLAEVERIIETAPAMRKELLSGETLLTNFYQPTGPQLGRLERETLENAYYPAIAQAGYQTDLEVKRALFAYLVNTNAVREHWRSKLVDPVALKIFGQPGEATDITQRAVLKAIERTVASGYIGETLEEAATQSPEVATLIEDPEYRISFSQRLIEALSTNPTAVLNWMETGFRLDKPKARTLPAIIFPEMSAMYGCEQDGRYHSEGDVWTHTRKLFENAQQQGLVLSSELIFGILLHDLGKPEAFEKDGDVIRFVGHEDKGVALFNQMVQRMGILSENIDLAEVERLIRDHGQMYAQSASVSYLKVCRLFPAGKVDNLYRLIQLDAASSIPASGTRDDGALFTETERIIDEIQSEKEIPLQFDELITYPKLSDVIGTGEIDAKYETIYRVYIDLIKTKVITFETKIEQAVELLRQQFLKSNRKWTGEYVKQKFAPGRLFVEKGIKGPEIGRQQNMIIEKLINGEFVDLEEYLSTT